MKSHIIKWGGSIITDPALTGSFDRKNTARLAKELYPFYEGCVMVHGTGHIGKPPAIKYHYLETGIIPKKDHLIALGIKDAILQLHRKVMGELIKAKIPAISLDILHFDGLSVQKNNEALLKNILVRLVRNGIMPVISGDLSPQADGTFKVISSDFITLLIAKLLKPENVIFLTDAEGVIAQNADYGKQPGDEILPYLTTDTLNKMKVFENDRYDVSGGMLKKVETALTISKHCKKCFIGSGYTRNVITNIFNNHPVTGTIIKA